MIWLNQRDSGVDDGKTMVKGKSDTFHVKFPQGICL